MKQKKWLWITLASLDALLTGFLFVIHIMMLVNVVGKSSAAVQEYSKTAGLIPYLIRNLNVYLWLFVIPLFLILAANIVVLVLYVKKSTAVKAEQISVSDLSAEEKEKLKAELLKDLNKE